ncbi:MAG: histidine phosphatase family protein, partial [Sphingomonas sp.]|nr:histidine phosphatase family protein [Sphingomonas sp.]
ALVERGRGASLGALWDRRIYLASASTLLELVQAQPDSAQHVLLAGHNPGLEDLALMLVPDHADDALRAAVYEKLPTGSRVELAFDIDHWAAADVARIVRFTRPRDLDPSLGPDEDTD